jgi:KDO2-lipid IV(A) lauroyltransferase
MSLAERRKLVRQNFINLAESMAVNALITSGRISDQRLLEMVDASDWENIDALMANSDKGLLIFSGHLGNWELLPQYLALKTGKPLNIITRKTNNSLLEKNIVKPLREHFGVNVFYKKKGLMKVLKAINKGENAGLMIDQRLNPPEGIPVEFFGRETGTTPTIALLHIRFNVTTIPIFMIQTTKGKYRFIHGDPVLWKDDGRPQDEQVRDLTQVHQKIIEDMVIQYPDQWFWMHNRWGLKKGDR